MTKQAVWIVCLIVAVLSVASVAYRMSAVSHFDSKTWREADEGSEFLDRRAMMKDLEQIFKRGEINSREQANQVLGPPQRTADDNPNIWYYNLGGQRSASAPEPVNWLELTFDSSGRLANRRITQELIVPVRG
jgi:hypothetical protein